MDIHPVTVHFPVALLTVYALFEIFRIPKLTKMAWYVPVKIVFLVLGWIGSIAAVFTGLTTSEAANIVGTWPTLVATHKNFGIATLVVFGISTVSYGCAALKNDNVCSKFILRAPIVIALAVIGLGCVTVTGALGGAMMYGANVDPFVGLIVNLLVAQ